ncbi:diphosphomevalonate decarboxylase [Candidatus Hodarchaeum mangrovi]
MKKTAIAHANIALIKYWGKRNEYLILPQNSSISMTLDKLHTTTTVEFSEMYNSDEVIINDKIIKEEEFERVVNHLDLFREYSHSHAFAKVVSKSNFPKKAGLASSASGFAALTIAASASLKLTLGPKELSIFARRGSGSAARSIGGGFVKWNRGENPDGSDSYAETIADPEYWPELTMIVTIVSTEEKKVSSRAGMKQTISTSPFYKAWLDTIQYDLEIVEEAIIEKNFSLLGEIMENNALKMHATMHTTKPPILYWESGSIALMKEIIALREEGTECYFTMDAGPQVKILCLKSEISKIIERIKHQNLVQEWFVCHPGNKAHLIDEHLF